MYNNQILNWRIKLTILKENPSTYIMTVDNINELLEHGEPAYIGLDIETTGLEAEDHDILSIAVQVIDKEYEHIKEGMEIIIHQGEEVLNKMDDWCWNTHTKSGLVDKVRESKVSLIEAEAMIVEYLKSLIPGLEVGNVRKNLPMFGNSLYLDRRFLEVHTKDLFGCFSYRSVDVSTYKEVIKNKYPALYFCVDKETKHTALDDIHESIEEMKIYDNHIQFL